MRSHAWVEWILTLQYSVQGTFLLIVPFSIYIFFNSFEVYVTGLLLRRTADILLQWTLNSCTFSYQDEDVNCQFVTNDWLSAKLMIHYSFLLFLNWGSELAYETCTRFCLFVFLVFVLTNRLIEKSLGWFCNRKRKIGCIVFFFLQNVTGPRPCPFALQQDDIHTHTVLPSRIYLFR